MNNQSKKLILIIDDEHDTVNYLKAFCEDNNYTTNCAFDGKQAMSMVKSQKPDLITLDISMPEQSGIKFYRELKEDKETANIPVIIISGITGMGGKPDDLKKFLSTRKQIPPPEAFIEKPIQQDSLLNTIKKLIG